MKQRIEVVANIILILAGCTAIYHYAIAYGTRERVMHPRIGERIQPLAGGGWPTHTDTLLVALKNGCHFCEEEMPFYRDLVSIRHAGRAKPAMMAVVPDDAATTRRWFATEHLNLPFISSVPLRTLGIEVTPTLLLVDSHGTVVKSWAGTLDQQARSAVLYAITAGP